ncbi:MAG: disulfide bond formation protein B [Alphaproteobacteria bacterium]|nr:disulfide bond formation protein B [Alphaproteobacteria bacterium]
MDCSGLLQFVPVYSEKAHMPVEKKIANTESLKSRMLFIFVTSATSIGGAWFFELVIGLSPCPLCLWQRWPYYIGMLIALLSLYRFFTKYKEPEIKLFALGIIFLFLANTVLGFYHAGIEWGWWPGYIVSCGENGNEIPRDIKTLSLQIVNAGGVRCDQATWRLFGLSLASYNV